MKKSLAILSLISLIVILTTGCNDTKSYAELLEDENKSVNRFLADQKVVGSFDEKNFEIGENAPYYQMDEDGNVYMQVLKLGTDTMAVDNQLIYFRFTRYNLSYYNTGTELLGEGNSESLESANTSFRYNNFSLNSSSQWGEGIQLPLKYLPIGSEIMLVLKSQLGWTSEIAYVNPYLYHIRYYKPQI
ncbi:MAG: DUF4827 family protein [Paramuribaculum sp.]|nr:DUF4827 family protein [Paramuribaculum sp.]